MHLTGSLGTIMKESASVAKTVAWDMVSATRRAELAQQWSQQKQGVHVHCAEGATQKEGPSAGAGLTAAIVSLLSGNRVRPDVAVTGEINLSGEVLEIGGLRDKMYGAKLAGCRQILYPSANQKAFDKIVLENPNLVDDDFVATPVSTITDVLNQLFLSHTDVILKSTTVSDRSRADAHVAVGASTPYRVRRRAQRSGR